MNRQECPISACSEIIKHATRKDISLSDVESVDRAPSSVIGLREPQSIQGYLHYLQGAETY